MDARTMLVLILLLLIVASLVVSGIIFMKGEGLRCFADGAFDRSGSLDGSDQEERSREIGVLMFFGALFFLVLWGSILLDSLA